MEPTRPAARTRLRDVLQPRKTRIDYLYDMGDSWEHRLTVSKVRQGEPGGFYPRLVGGEWAGPPEDCGGIPGYENLIEAMADPKHPERQELLDWIGEPFDPEAFNLNAINLLLKTIKT